MLKVRWISHERGMVGMATMNRRSWTDSVKRLRERPDSSVIWRRVAKARACSFM